MDADHGQRREEGRTNLKEYFGSRHGIGVLASAGAEGAVDAAIYSRPHVFDDGSIAFVMRERLTHRNVGENPRAAYLFIEDGARLDGARRKFDVDAYVRKVATPSRPATAAGTSASHPRRKERA